MWTNAESEQAKRRGGEGGQSFGDSILVAVGNQPPEAPEELWRRCLHQRIPLGNLVEAMEQR